MVAAVSLLAERSPETSAPAVKARAPAPVATMARQVASSSSCCQIPASSASMHRDMALALLGLSMVTIPMWGPWPLTVMGMAFPWLVGGSLLVRCHRMWLGYLTAA